MENQRKARGLDSLLLSAIFLLTVIIAVFIFISGDSKFQKNTSAANNDKVDETTATLTETQSGFPDIQIIKESSNDISIPYSMQYPKTKFNTVNKEISKYIADSKEKYLDTVYLFRNENKNNSVVGDFRISLQIHQYKNDYYSFVFTNKSSVDKTKYDATIQTYLFNNNTGEFVNMYQLLDEKVKNLEVLAEYVQKQITSNPAYKEYLYTEKVQTLTEPKWRHFKKFSIVDNELVIYYDKDEIASPLAGMPTIRIPMSFLNPILDEKYRTNDTSSNTIIKTTHKGKRVALTFDDGPHEKVTKQILQTLEKYDAKATFFMVGHRVENNASLVREILASGHEIGNHSWNHSNLTTLTPKQVLSQYNSTNDVIYEATGQYPTVFRPPYGARNKCVNDLVSVPIVLWTIDTLDWKYRDADKILPMVKNKMHNNAIILMHDIHQSTADGLDSVLAYLQDEGYEFVTVSEILNYQTSK
ncbi:polysaccharide deacetylase family protein [Lysinibacillus telephonicus]|uniref:polysaccharide deacetylase family protein n=1 Tax=Lysinibacillus telephonicus TaxID=1714840 RepID=UPI0031FD6A03